MTEQVRRVSCWGQFGFFISTTEDELLPLILPHRRIRSWLDDVISGPNPSSCRTWRPAATDRRSDRVSEVSDRHLMSRGKVIAQLFERLAWGRSLPGRPSGASLAADPGANYSFLRISSAVTVVIRSRWPTPVSHFTLYRPPPKTVMISPSTYS